MPAIPALILHIIYSWSLREGFLGDIEEEYTFRRAQLGRNNANLWLWLQALRSVPGAICFSLTWSFIMFKNYLKITTRILVKYKGFSFINIAGLAIGMACCLFISLWVLDELSYDRFNEHADRLYRVIVNNYYSGNQHKGVVTPAPLARTLKADFPEIIESARFRYLPTMLVKHRENAFYETDIVTTDPSFFSMFTFPFIKGSSNTALNDPNSVVISRDIAEKYFGTEEPVGKTLILDNSLEYNVSGVIENVPSNSHVQYEIVIPWSYMHRMKWYRDDYWDSRFLHTYVLLHESASAQDVNEKIKMLIKEHVEQSATELELQPVPDIHLFSVFYGDTGPGDIIYVYIFSIIALIVLLIACINFMNLSTARSSNRAKEIGLRKVVGAQKSHVIRQFYGESFIMAFFALILAVIVVQVLLPQFNTLSGKQLTLINASYAGSLIIGLIVVTLLTGIVAGSYPALYLSTFTPAAVLRGSQPGGVKSTMFRKILVVLQFSLSIFLIIGTLVVYSQLHYMKNMKLGWDKNQLLYINMRGNISLKYSALKDEFLKGPGILSVSASQSLPSGFGNSSTNINWEGKDPNLTLSVYFNCSDYDFVNTMKIDMAEGRPFSRDFPSDTVNAVLINEEFKRIMGVESAVSTPLWFAYERKNVVGVMKDFQMQSAREKIEPVIFLLSGDSIHYILIRISPENVQSTLSYIESTWHRVLPDYPIEYRFFDERFDSLYRAESRMGTLLGYFTILAVFIACLGLFGLTSFTTEQRTREIGIRKVFGAGALNITYQLCTEFVKLVLIANVIAWPAAYLIMNNWLAGFEHRVGLNASIFLVSGIVTVIIAILAVGNRTIKAARANPADSLRHE